MNLTETLYGVLFSPAATFRMLSQSKNWFSGIIVFLIVMGFNMLVSQGITDISPLQEVIPIPASFISVMALMGLVISVVMLFIMAGIYSLGGEILFKYATANAKGLLTCLSFAVLPGIIGVALQYITTFMGFTSLAALISLIVGIWLIVLQIISIREALSLTTSQAIVLFLIPLIILIVTIVLFSVIIITTLPFYK